MTAPRPQRPAPGARRSPQPGGQRAPREEYVAPPKKGAPPALMIGMLGLIVVMSGVFIYGLATKKERQNVEPKQVESDNRSEWDGIRRKINEAEKRYLATTKLRTEDDKFEEFNAQAAETMDYIASVLDEVEVMLEPVRDEDDNLPEEYVGYLAETKPLNIWLEDLTKSIGF